MAFFLGFNRLWVFEDNSRSNFQSHIDWIYIGMWTKMRLVVYTVTSFCQSKIDRGCSLWLCRNCRREWQEHHVARRRCVSTATTLHFGVRVCYFCPNECWSPELGTPGVERASRGKCAALVKVGLNFLLKPIPTTLINARMNGTAEIPSGSPRPRPKRKV